MARSIGSYTIQFGMVCIPAHLHTATSSHDVSFNQLHATCGTRVRQQLVCPTCDNTPVERTDIVKGYEIAKGRYVQVTEDELRELPLPSKHTISIDSFVKTHEIDPVLFENTYWLSPNDGGARPLALLMQALDDRQVMAVATITLRKREQRCVLRMHEGRLLLHPLYAQDELRFETVEPGPVLSDRERTMAGQLVDQLTRPFDPQHTDHYLDALKALLEAKAAGAPAPVVAARPVAPPADLEALLAQSMAKVA